MARATKWSDSENVKANDSDGCCIIEIDGQAVGLLAAKNHEFVFYAAVLETWPLDRRVFSSRWGAEQAIRDLCGVRQDNPETELANDRELLCD